MVKSKRLVFTFFILFILLAISPTAYSLINVINVPLLTRGGLAITVQPATEDSYMQGGTGSATNFGSSADLLVKISGNINASRKTILNFDFTSLPGGATITSAYLELYFYSFSGGGDPNGETLEVLRCTRTDWVEAEVTWDDYKTSSAWTSGGGDTTDTNKATVVMPASFSWVQWDVTAQAQYAQANTSEIIHMILDWASGATDDSFAKFYSKEESTQTTLRPKLIINYTP